MKKTSLPFMFLAALLAAMLLFSLSSSSPALADRSLHPFAQTTLTPDRCRAILQKVAENLGWDAPEMYVNDNNCQMQKNGNQDGANYQIVIQLMNGSSWCNDCESSCTSANNCRCVNVHGLPGSVMAGDHNATFMDLCDGSCDLRFRITIPTEGNTPIDPLPIAEQIYFACSAMGCAQGQTDGNVAPPSGNTINPISPGGDDNAAPPFVDNPGIQSPPESSSGPLSTGPLVPLAGAIIGTLAGWLISTGVGTIRPGTSYRPPPAPAPWSPYSPVQPPQLPVQPPQLPQPPVRPAQPPPLPVLPVPPPQQPPPIQAEIPNPPTVLKPPKTPFDNVWDIVTNLTGSTSTVIGTLSEFFDFQDSPETLDRISSAIKIFRANPSEITRDIYLKAARQSANMRLKGAADAMGIVGNLVDAGDAVKKGLELAEKRGYTGIDKGMAISGEAAKKVLTFFATKNPWAGLVNTAFGGFTEMISGNRYDIGWAIDKGADAWDKTTQEYLSYTNGSLRPGSYTDLLAGDPEIARKDEFLRQVRRIKSQVDAGKLSRQDGAVRIRKLRSTSLGGE